MNEDKNCLPLECQPSEYAEKFDKWAMAYGYIRAGEQRKILSPLFDLQEKWSLQSRDLNPKDYAYEAWRAINDCLCLFHGCGEPEKNKRGD